MVVSQVPALCHIDIYLIGDCKDRAGVELGGDLSLTISKHPHTLVVARAVHVQTGVEVGHLLGPYEGARMLLVANLCLRLRRAAPSVTALSHVCTCTARATTRV